MSEQKQRQRQLNKFKQKIKKDLTTQPIQNQRVSYSVVEKKSKTGISKNVRVLFFVHANYIAYSKQFDKTIKIPFQSLKDLPVYKQQYPQQKIDKVSSKAKTLTITFKGKNQEPWEMNCSSAQLARNWSKIIKASIDNSKQQANNTPQQIVIPPKPFPPANNQNTMQQILPPLQSEQNPNQPKKQQQVKKEQNLYKQDLNTNKNTEQIREPIIQQKIQQINEQQNNYYKNQQQNYYEQSPKKKQPIIDIFNQNPKNYDKPESTLFVGSVAVDNAQDQDKLKQKIQIFSKMNMKMKGQYQQKKQQQRNIKQQIRNQDNPLSNIFAFSTNIKLQIEKMRKQWGYQFAKGQNQYDIVYSFKIYAQLVTQKIIDELGLQQKKRYYQPFQQNSNSLKYQINGVIFEIFLTELKQLTGYQQKGTIVSRQQSKLAKNQFKNLNYVLSLTHNKGKIRVPLSAIFQYKGFVIFAKVIIPTAENYEQMDALQRQLEILQAQSRINTSVFQDPECAKIIALQSKAYEKLARAQNLPNKRFDLCYIDNLNHFLPNDFNNFSKDKPYEKLRSELIQQEQFQENIFYGEDMCTLSSRLKLPQNYRDGMDELIAVSKTIYERIQIFIQKLQNLEIMFCNSKQISKQLHNYGINMRYLGVVLEKVNINWIKQIFMSQICARCGKNFLNFDLQDCLFNLSESNTQSVRNFQVKQVISFLNKMFGKGQETDVFWKQLNRQAQAYYKVSINKDQINQGFLLQALQIHCNFALKNIDETINLFDSTSPFNIQNLASFQINSKVYDMSFTELYTSVKNLLQQPSDDSYQQLRILLNLHRVNNIPNHFKMSDTYDKILQFLVNWLPPTEARQVYYPQQIQLGQILPSKTLYQIKLAQIRWGLKNNQLQDSQRVKQWMVDHINKWLGQAHPILTQLYELFANYHLLFKTQEKKAVNYSKSAIKNQEKVVGANNQKMADCYYLLGTIYLHYGKKVQALNTLKKAYQIIIKSQNDDSEACGQVCLKLGQLYLTLNSLQQAVQLGLKAMQILAEYDKLHSQIRAIELVCRCYQLNQDWESYMQLIEQKLVHIVDNFLDEVQLTERIIKVIILPSFKIISDNNSAISQRVIKILQELPETTRAPNMAFNFLKMRIQQKTFPQKFLQVLSDIEEVIQEIDKNGMLTRWKGFENLSNKSLLNKVGVNMENKGFYFLANLQATSIFIGSSYIYGLLSEI